MAALNAMIYSTEQKSSPLTESNAKIIDEIIQQIYQLFEQLHQSSTSTNSKTPDVILTELDRIFTRFTDRTYHTAGDILAMFEIILKNYLDLLDTTSCMDVLGQRYTRENTAVFSSLYQSFTQKDTCEIVRKMSFKTRQQVYYRILDQVNTSKSIAAFLDTDSSHEDHITNGNFNFAGLLLILIFQYLNSLNVKLLDIELRKYQTTLFVPFIRFIDEHFLTNKCGQHDLLIREILKFLRMTTDQTLTIPIFINAHCPQACQRWLTLPNLYGSEYSDVLSIIYNIARHDDGAHVLNKSQCHETLAQFSKNILDSQIDFTLDKKLHDELQLICFMIKVLTTDASELPTENTNWLIKYRLTPVFFDVIVFRTRRQTKFFTPEIVLIAMKLCTNDSFMHSISVNNLFIFPGFIINMLAFILHSVKMERFDRNALTGDIATIIAIANILWSTSFQEQYRTILFENIETIQKLIALESSDVIEKILPYIYISRHMSSLKRATDGIWHNLYPSIPTNLDVNSAGKKTSTCSVMISYCHNDIDFCRKLYETLRNHTDLSILTDFNNSKYLWNDIAQMMYQSDVVLFLISSSFYNSRPCRQEFVYGTDTLKKPFIPIIINSDYEPSGWLKARISTSKYICFDQGDFMEHFHQLISIIKESLPVNAISERNISDVRQWNQTDVKQWFIRNNLLLQLHEFYRFQNGDELLLYAQAILAYSWTKEYERIKVRFEDKFKQQSYLSPHDFLKFINALQDLRNNKSGSI